MPSQAHAEPRISVLHGDQVPAGMTVQEIGTQMVPPREVVLGYGPTREHLVTRLALCQSPGAGQHGVDSKEEAFGILPMRHSHRLSACHPPGSKNLGCLVSIPEPFHPSHPQPTLIVSKYFTFCLISQDRVEGGCFCLRQGKYFFCQ